MSFWLISLAYRLFGYNAFALRFFSALATLLSACAIALWAWRENGRWAVPFVLMIFIANNVVYGLHFARYGDADSQYQFFFTIATLICVALCLISLFTLIVTRHRLSAARRYAAIGSLLWVVVPIVFYTLANVKFRWYVYSCLMGMPVLTVTLVYGALEAVSVRKLMVACLSFAFAGFAFSAYMNIQNVLSTTFDQTIQGFLKENLDRYLDEGIHAYIQYSENQQTTWMQGSVLTAEMYGDVICLNGGVEGYLSDEESAILYISKNNNISEITQLQQDEVVRNENYYLIVFEK